MTGTRLNNFHAVISVGEDTFQFNEVERLQRAIGNGINRPELKQYFDIVNSSLQLTKKESYLDRTIYPFQNNFLKFVGPKAIVNDDLRAPASAFIIETLKRSKYQAKNFLAAGKTCFKEAVFFRYLSRNPFEGITLPKIQHPGIQTIPDDELNKIITKVDNEVARDFFLFLKDTGLRRNEGINLTKKNFDEASNLIQVGDESFSTKTHRIRYVPLTKSAREIIERRVSKLKSKDDFIFQSPNGYKYNADHLTHIWIQAVKDSGVTTRHKLKSLRSTFGSRVLQSGNQIESVAALLGNSIEVCQKSYAKLKIENLQKAIQSLDSNS